MQPFMRSPLVRRQTRRRNLAPQPALCLSFYLSEGRRSWFGCISGKTRLVKPLVNRDPLGKLRIFCQQVLREIFLKLLCSNALESKVIKIFVQEAIKPRAAKCLFQMAQKESALFVRHISDAIVGIAAFQIDVQN